MRDRLIHFCCCDTAPWPGQTKEMSLSGLMFPRGLESMLVGKCGSKQQAELEQQACSKERTNWTWLED